MGGSSNSSEATWKPTRLYSVRAPVRAEAGAAVEWPKIGPGKFFPGAAGKCVANVIPLAAATIGTPRRIGLPESMSLRTGTLVRQRTLIHLARGVRSRVGT